jgi:hypothetical protein
MTALDLSAFAAAALASGRGFAKTLPFCNTTYRVVLIKIHAGVDKLQVV